MNITTESPNVIIAGSLSGTAAGMGPTTSIAIAYSNLISGAGITTINGIKVFNLSSAAICAANKGEVGYSETAAEVATNYTLLQKIADYCNANGIKVFVEADLTSSATWSDGHNQVIEQWAPLAAAVGLPIAYVEGVNEPATAGSSVEPSTVTSSSSFATVAANEANSVWTLLTDYAGSSYKLTAANLSVGDMEGGGGAPALFWQAYDAAATTAGLPTFSFATPDTGFYGPWLNIMSVPSWHSYLEQTSSAAASLGMSLNVDVQGTISDLTAAQYVRQAEQNAADVAMLQATGSVAVGSIMLQSWGVLPIGSGLVSSPSSISNAAAEIKATYSLYATGLITATGSLGIDAPGQLVFATGATHSLRAVSVLWDGSDLGSGSLAAVVLIDQTGTLAAKQSGHSGTVTNIGNNILVLSGDSADLAAELSSVTILEASAGADTVDIEAFSELGQTADSQIQVFAAAPGQSVANVATTNGAQGWLTSSASLNTGTVIGGGSVITSETLTWSTTGTLSGGAASSAAQTAFQKIDSVHEPLAEVGIETVSPSTFGTSQSVVVDNYNPSIDNNAFFGYANDTYAAQVGFSPLPEWSYAFNAADQLTPLVVKSTVNTFDPVSGQLQSSVDTLAADPITAVDLTGTHSDTYATAFNNGGSVVTQYNTGSNSAWQATWGQAFASATLTYDGAGTLVELILQGGPACPNFALDYVFDPNNGALWEVFEDALPPPQAAGSNVYAGTSNPYQPGYVSGPEYVTLLNNSDDPNWDYNWGTSLGSASEVFVNSILIANFPGFAENFPQQLAGDINNYQYEFVCGDTLDLMYLPGTISINLNALSTVTIDSQTIASGLTGLSSIDAGAATGTVTLTGLLAGGSELVGGDDITAIKGYGHDTITAGSGVTTIDTGAGGSTVNVSNAKGTVTVAGNANTVTAVNGSQVTLSGSADLFNGSDANIALTGTGALLTVVGNGNTVVAGANDTVTEIGAYDVFRFANGGTMQQSGLCPTAEIIGDHVVVWMGASGETLTALGNFGQITGAANEVINASGNDNVIGTWGDADISLSGLGDIICGASNDTISATAGSQFFLTTGASDLFIGSGVSVSISQLGASLTIDGDANIVTASAGQTVTVAHGNGNQINGSNLTIVAGSGAGISIAGTSDTLQLTGPAVTIAATAGSSLSVVGSATNVASSLAALEGLAEAGKLTGIALSDASSPTITLSDAQINADWAALSLIRTPYILDPSALNAVRDAQLPNVISIVVSDTAADVAANLGALQGLAAAGKLAGIALSNAGTPALTLTAAQLAADAGALPKIGGSYRIALTGKLTVAQAAAAQTEGVLAKVLGGAVISDTAANVQAALATLQGYGAEVASIALTNSTAPTVTVTAAGLIAYAGALLKVTGSFNIALTGTATAAQANAANPTLVAKLLKGYAVVDTAANVVTYISGLQTRAAAGLLTSITLSNAGTPTLTLTAAQLAADAGALLKIGGSYRIALTGMLTVAQAAAAQTEGLLAKVIGGAVISDTAANVQAALATLQGYGAEVASIALTNSTAPTVTVTAAGLIAYAGALLKVTGSFNIALTGTATAAQANAANPTLVAKLLKGYAVVDTAANVVTDISGLQTRAAAGLLSSITLSNAGTPTLTLTAAQLAAAQLAADGGALLKIGGSYGITVLGTATAAQAGGLTATVVGKVSGGLQVADTAANVSANLAGLQALSAAGRLAGITLNDTGMPTMSLTAAQVVSDAGALLRIGGLANLVITGTHDQISLMSAQITTVLLTELRAINSTQQPQTITLQNGLNLTASVQDGAAITVVGAQNADVINLGSGTDEVYLGSVAETVNGGAGADTYVVTASTIGATIRGGSGTNALHAQGGGTFVMGSNITGIGTLYLDNAASSYTLIANGTAGMTIQAGSNTATVTIGAPTQSVRGAAGQLTVKASSANAGALVSGGTGGATLEVTTGGTVALNALDTNVTFVRLDAATNLSLGKIAFITAVGASYGHNTITAGAANQTLESIGGNDTLIGSASYGDIFLGTTSGLAGDTIRNFAGSDVIDVTDMLFGLLRNPALSQSGVLQLNGGTRSLQLSLPGISSLSSLNIASDGHGGTLVSLSHQ